MRQRQCFECKSKEAEKAGGDSRESLRKSINQVFRDKWANKWKETIEPHKRI